jgi:hypothetical protein
MKDSIRYLERSKIDDMRWNYCISHAVNGNIYAYSWYLDIVSPGWSALVSNDYGSVFPLTGKKKYGISYLAQPFFTQQLGIFSTELLSEATVGAFLEKIPSRFRLLEINLNAYNKISASGFDIRMFTNLELDLIPDYETISRSYSENLRRNLKKAANAGLILKPMTDAEHLIALFRANKGSEISTFRDEDYQTLMRLITEGERHRAFHMTGVHLPDGSLCAGAVFAFASNKAVFLFSATGEKARESAAMPFLIDDFIRVHSQTQLTLDFEGSNDADLARFYRSFGAKDCPYPHIRRNTLPAYVNFVRDLMK